MVSQYWHADVLVAPLPAVWVNEGGLLTAAAHADAKSGHLYERIFSSNYPGGPFNKSMKVFVFIGGICFVVYVFQIDINPPLKK